MDRAKYILDFTVGYSSRFPQAVVLCLHPLLSQLLDDVSKQRRNLLPVLSASLKVVLDLLGSETCAYVSL